LTRTEIGTGMGLGFATGTRLNQAKSRVRFSYYFGQPQSRSWLGFKANKSDCQSAKYLKYKKNILLMQGEVWRVANCQLSVGRVGQDNWN